MLGTAPEKGKDMAEYSMHMDDRARAKTFKPTEMKTIKTSKVVNLKNDKLGTVREYGQDLAEEDEEANKKGSFGNLD